MKKLSAVLSLIALTLGLCNTVFAATEYVIVNVNAETANQANVYKLDSVSGALTQIASLKTGNAGLAPLGSGSFTNIQQAITNNASCIFVMDAGSSDIATFSKSSNYQKVGNYSNSALDSNAYGGSLGLAPNGKFLYSSYSSTGNIAAWAVNADCSLTFVAAYVPSASFPQLWPIAQFKVTPNGRALVVPITLPIPAVELFAIDAVTGALSDEGYVQIAGCNACLLGGLDITKDSKLAVVAASNFNDQNAVPFVISIDITSVGLARPRAWDFGGNIVGGLQYNGYAVLDAGAYAGSGNLYFSTVGSGEGGCGIITASFVEKPLSIQATTATLTSCNRNGAIALAGDLMLVGQYPNQIGVYSVSSDGSILLLDSTKLANPKAAEFSLSLFPNAR